MFPKVSLVFASLLAAAGLASGYVVYEAQLPCARHYVVQPGDTCISIALKNQVPTYQLFTANPGLINPQCTNLRPGQTICLGIVGRQCHRVYTVRPGDTCNIIAEKNDIPLGLLYAENPNINRPSCNNLQVNEVLCVARRVLLDQSDSYMQEAEGCNSYN